MLGDDHHVAYGRCLSSGYRLELDGPSIRKTQADAAATQVVAMTTDTTPIKVAKGAKK